MWYRVVHLRFIRFSLYRKTIKTDLAEDVRVSFSTQPEPFLNLFISLLYSFYN